MSTGMNIAVIGGGWYGCYISMRLKKEDPDLNVVLYEAKDSLFHGASQYFGNKLHTGPHYSRSAVTRDECRKTYIRFKEEFPTFFEENTKSIYCLGKQDSDGLASRISWAEYQESFQELQEIGEFAQELDCDSLGYSNVHGGFNVNEGTMYLDVPKKFFTNELPRLGVTVIYNREITDYDIDVKGSGVNINNEHFDWMINCTYYQSLTSNTLPFSNRIFYQPSIGLLYAQEEKYTELHHPFAFTVMDGWFPSILPALYKDNNNPFGEKRMPYILSHAKYSHLGNCDTVKEAQDILKEVTDNWVYRKLRPCMEEAVGQLYTHFPREFEYIGWKSGISTKLCSMTEFRGTLVWKDGPVVNVFSGKVGTIFIAGDDVVKLVLRDQLQHVQGSSIDIAAPELNQTLFNYNGAGVVQSWKDLN